MNNNLPKNWTETSLADVSLKLQSGGTPSTKNTEYYSGGSIPFVKIEDITAGGKYLKSTSAKITEAGLENSAAWIVPCDTLLYSMYATYGLPTISKIPAATSQAIIACIPNSEVLTLDYLYYFLLRLRPDLKRFKYTKGTTQENLSAGSVSRIAIPLAPPPEQKRIVGKIEELFTDLYAGVEALKKSKALIKKYRQSVLKSAFQGVLTTDWRKENRHLICGENRPVNLVERSRSHRNKLLRDGVIRYSRNVVNSKSIYIDNLPTDWQLAKGDDVFFVTKLAGFEYSKYFKLEESGEIPVIRAQNVRPLNISCESLFYIDNRISKLLARSALTKECVLVTFIGAGIGDVSYFHEKTRWHLAPNVAKMEPYDRDVNLKLFTYYLLSPAGQQELFKHMKATAQPSLSMGTIRDIDFPIPSVAEQKVILEQIESYFSIADATEKIVDDGLKQAERLRQSILKKAFEGRLVHQDPNDEPAQKLLERIIAQKTKAEVSKNKVFKKKVSK